MMLSSGATTHRIDLLEARGLTKRLPDPADRRGTRVRFTSTGKGLVDAVVTARLETEANLLSGLSTSEREERSRLPATWTGATGL